MGRRREQQPDFITNLVLLIGRAVWVLISWPFRVRLSKRASRLDQQYYLACWELIETQASPSQAIVDADKLVDRALRDLGMSGETFADRLRAAEVKFSPEIYQSLWEAHKLRNQIVHEVGYQVSPLQARRALNFFRKALQSLGAL